MNDGYLWLLGIIPVYVAYKLNAWRCRGCDVWNHAQALKCRDCEALRVL